ncbi:MAG: hypothetical protein IKV75_02170 [Bacteroidales bacterium]|nr:hypothetical protein [Bacteroidales bacterium]
MKNISFLLLCFTSLVSCKEVPQGPVATITNDPYEGIVWETVLQLKSSLHVHTANSTIEHGAEEGTTVTPAEQIERYEQLGYDVLAITDHDYVTYPWSEYGKGDSPMISIKGNELSKNDNICAYFCDWLDLPGEGPEKTVGFSEGIRQAGAAGGILYLAHPKRSGSVKNPLYSANLLRKYPQIYGIEVLNVGQFEKNNSIEIWDNMLIELLPERQCWGTSSDDAHSVSKAGYGWTIFLTTERTEAAVKDALKNGNSFFSTPKIVKTVPKLKVTPTITSIVHDTVARTLTITATDYERIEWTSMGQVVATGETISYASVEGVDKYLRATVYGPGGATFTQPWTVEIK